MSQFWQVLAFSYRDRLRAKVFLYTTLFVIVLLALIMSIPKLEAMFSDGEDRYMLVDKPMYFIPQDTKALPKNISMISPMGEASDLREQLQKEGSELAGYIIIELPTHLGGPPSIQVIAKSKPDSEVLQPIQNFVQTKYTSQVAEQLKVTTEQYQKLTAQVPLMIDDLSKSEDEAIYNAYIPVYAAILLLSFSIISFGTSVATAVAAEKSSRIMEVMITKVRPIWLMFGKVIGVGLAGLTQVGIIAIAAVLLSQVLYEGPIEVGPFRLDVSTLEASMFVYFLVFYILGYFFYATLYAAVGSLVSRSEEVNQVIMPVTMIFMVAMYGAMFSMTSPDNTFAVVGSFVPFLAPLMMFIRIGMTDVPTIQILISIAIITVSIIIGCWIAAKIYRVGVLTYGKRPTWKEIFAAIKMYRV